MTRAMIIVALLLLAGCALKPVVKEPIVVKVPVPVGCEPKPVIEPRWPLDVIRPGANIYEQTAAMLTEISLRAAYEADLRGAIADCIQQGKNIEERAATLLDAPAKKSWAEQALDTLWGR
jgi:hypothetical protein